MKLVFWLIFSLTLSWTANAANHIDIVDCIYPIENDTKSVQLVCGDYVDGRMDECFEVNFNGDQSASNRKNVISLDTGDCQKNTFDSNLLDQFPSLQRLDITNHTRNLPDRLSNIESLQVLIASNNNMTIIPSSLFDRAQNLSVIDFSHNEIEEIPIFENKNLTLKEFDLSDNKISHVGTETFNQFKQLEKLVLSENRIQTINITAFAKIEQLKELLLDHNQIKQFECTNLTKLEKVNLAHNQLTQINFALLSRNLEVLNVEANNLTELGAIADDSFKNMSSFSAFGNQIPCENVIKMCQKFGIGSCHCNTSIDSIESTTVPSFSQSTKANEPDANTTTSTTENNFTTATSNSTTPPNTSSTTDQTVTADPSSTSSSNLTVSPGPSAPPSTDPAITPDPPGSSTVTTPAPSPTPEGKPLSGILIFLIIVLVLIFVFIIFYLFKKGIIQNAFARLTNRPSANANQQNDEIENAKL